MIENIAHNLEHIKSDLPESVTLIAVSKTKPNDYLTAAYNAGHLDFGENYVQELVTKSEELPKDIRWHFIGHLQRNKVKYIAPFVHLIHGVDSLRLLKEINKQARKCERIIPVLLQIHIAQEETKFGLDEAELQEVLSDYDEGYLQNVSIQGMMGMASNTNNTEKVANEFSHLKQLFDQTQQKLGSDFNTLSMGMSADYKLAIENGSTMIRVGSAIFGARQYA